MADHFWKWTSQTISSGIVVLGKTSIIFTAALAVGHQKRVSTATASICYLFPTLNDSSFYLIFFHVLTCTSCSFTLFFEIAIQSGKQCADF